MSCRHTACRVPTRCNFWNGMCCFSAETVCLKRTSHQLACDLNRRYPNENFNIMRPKQKSLHRKLRRRLSFSLEERNLIEYPVERVHWHKDSHHQLASTVTTYRLSFCHLWPRDRCQCSSDNKLAFRHTNHRN